MSVDGNDCLKNRLLFTKLLTLIRAVNLILLGVL